MLKTSVQSSNIAAVAWQSETLYITFHGRGDAKTYKYSGVPIDVYEGLVSAPSVGGYFAKHVKNVYDATPMAVTE